MPCQPHVFLPPSPPWLSWEKKVLPDLDFSWVPQVLPLIGRLISNLVLAREEGIPKGRCAWWSLTSPASYVSPQQHYFSEEQVLQTDCSVLVLSSGESCLQAQHSVSLLWRAWSQICINCRCEELDKLSLSQTRGLRTGGKCPSSTGVALANLSR